MSQPKYASQLRPISLLFLPGKILERIIGKRLNKYLEQNNILSPKQHGFRKGKSTTTSIVSLLTDVYNNINDSLPTYAIYFYLKKAFDTVSHLKLLNKLKKIKIAQPTLNWFRSYLEKRTQKTNVDGDISSELNVTFGVPQGSVLGPVLFSIYVNDIPKEVGDGIQMYADDTVIYGTDSQQLQRKLNSVVEWCSKNILTLNISKTKWMI